MRKLFALALCALSTPAFAAPGPTLLAETADLAKYSPNSLPDAKLIDAVKNAAVFKEGGANYKFGLALTADPQPDARGTIYKAAAMMSDASNKLFYRKLQILVGGNPRKVLGVAKIADIALADTHFTINTGLIDRMVVVQDEANELAFSFPLGVGGIDEAVMGDAYRILTPKFHGAVLQRATVNPSRTEPAYYRGRPFMPITSARGTVTAIAFHITILDDNVADQYGLNYLVRGFESHGCMRMREKDLLQLFTIVMNGGSDKLPVDVDNHVASKNPAGVRNVYPLNTTSFNRVTYFPEAPHYKRDDLPNEHLVMMDRAQGQPDMRRLDNPLAPAMDDLLPSGEADADLMYSQFLAP